MKIVTFTIPGSPAPRLGAWLAERDEILDFRAEPAGLFVPEVLLDCLDEDGPFLPRARELHDRLLADPSQVRALREEGAVLPRAEVTLLSPVPRPGKVVCIGLNYRDHAREAGVKIPEVPILFSKFPTCIIGPGQPVVLPPGSREVDYEAELAVVIGRRASRVARERAFEHVLGYTCFNDVSARDFQFKDGQWQRGKSCDTFAPLGSAIVTRDEIPDPHTLDIRLHLNGETLQHSNTGQLLFGVPHLVAFISETITLEPGDVIATGTPPGVGFARKPPIYLKDGDIMQVEIEGLGVLENPVVGAQAR